MWLEEMVKSEAWQVFFSLPPAPNGPCPKGNREEVSNPAKKETMDGGDVNKTRKGRGGERKAIDPIIFATTMQAIGSGGGGTEEGGRMRGRVSFVTLDPPPLGQWVWTRGDQAWVVLFVPFIQSRRKEGGDGKMNDHGCLPQTYIPRTIPSRST